MYRRMVVGMDIETTGTTDKNQLIQIGIALSTTAVISEYVGWDESDIVWDEEAASIHKIPKAVVVAAERKEVVEDRLLKYLDQYGLRVNEVLLVPVGYNVGTFDVPYIRRTFPRLSEMISYQAIDLNSIIFTMSELIMGEVKYAKFTGWKSRAKKFAEEFMGSPPQWHDAGYDALAGLVAWHWFRDRVSMGTGSF